MATALPDDSALPLVLLAVAREWDAAAQALVNAALGERVARPALMRLLPALTEGPIRVTALAERADVTKQAVAQALRACEQHGWVAYAPDPTDGRAVLVSLTTAGHEAVALGRDALRQVQRDIEDRVGAATLERLTRDLRRVQAAMIVAVK